MTKQEFKASKEYQEMIEKIKSYSIGFEFNLNYSKIPKPKCNALEIVTRDCIKMGILESIQMGLDIEGNIVDETFRRIGE